eukprot:GHVN01025786.1.p1 GENE.GHVN01025786.1~~GHVN01025786.1.p1  ORF type:complete len:102 (+),score=2.98 GHVN01025786.1:186-491(+)
MAFEYIGPTSKAALDHGFTILHSLIARNAFIVAEYSPLCNEESEMVAEVCRDALNRLPATGNGDCYVYENKKFSYVGKRKLTRVYAELVLRSAAQTLSSFA